MAKDRELRVKILGDSSSAERAFKRTADASDKVGPSAKVAQGALDKVSGALTSKLGPASGVADDALQKIGSSAIASGSALSLGLAGGAAVAGGALAAFAADGVATFLSLAEEIRNFQRTSGASAEDSSRFVAVLDDLKISSEAGATAMFKLGREVSAGAPKLRELGIEVARNADGSANLTETLLNVADAYAKAPDQASKTAVAFAAFGKQAQGLLPLLEKGRQGLAEFFEGAEKHGQIFDQDDIDKARELELALDDLEDMIRGVQLAGAKALVPFLTDVAEVGSKIGDILADINQKSGGFLKHLGGAVVKELAGPVGDAADVLNVFGDNSDKAKDSTKELGQASEETAGSVGELGEETAEAAEAHKAMETAARAHAAAVKLVASANESLISSQLSVADGMTSLAEKQDDARQKEKDLADAIKAHGRGSHEAQVAAKELDQARRDELRSVDALAKARRDFAVQQAAQAGATVSDADKYRIYRDELIKLKDAVAPGSPLRQHMEELINQIPPPVVAFAVHADTSQAVGALLGLQKLAASIRAETANILGGGALAAEAIADRLAAPKAGPNVLGARTTPTTVTQNFTINGTNLSGQEIAREVSWRGRGWGS